MQGETLVLFSSKTAAFCCVEPQVSPDLAGSTQVVAEKVDAYLVYFESPGLMWSNC